MPTPTHTCIHRHTHINTLLSFHTHKHMHTVMPPPPHMAILCMQTHTHTYTPSSHTHTPLSPSHTPIPAYCASSCSQQLFLPSLLDLAFKAFMTMPQRTTPAIPPRGVPGHRRGGSPSLSINLSVCLCRHQSLWESPQVRHSECPSTGGQVPARPPIHTSSLPFALSADLGSTWLLSCPELVLGTGEGGGCGREDTSGGGRTHRKMSSHKHYCVLAISHRCCIWS